MIYLAPIQGFTDYIYRKAFDAVFSGIDKYFIPYISVKNETVLRKYIQEIWPENNPQKIVIPQVLAKDSDELLFLTKVLKEYGYTEINLNLGCPYPMVTNRGKGSGLIPFPEKIDAMLSDFFEKTDIKLSVKTRAGLINKNEIEKTVPVFEKFPLTEVIFHPRIAAQLYKGKVLEDSFKIVSERVTKELVYNGDVFTIEDFNRKKQLFPSINNWMLGRGILMNPFLSAEIKGEFVLQTDRQEKLQHFHNMIFDSYSEKLDNKGNVLNKMKQFWSYFSYSFQNQAKVFKSVKKIRNPKKYLTEANRIFNVQPLS